MRNKTFKKDPFSAWGNSTISENYFYLFISLFTILGLLTTGIAAHFAPDKFTTLGFIFIGLLLPIVGILLATSDSIPLSLIGYTMITIPLGLVLGNNLNYYSPDVVTKVTTLTAMITVIMGISGFLFPNFYSKIGGFLAVSLVSIILIRILGIFIPFLQLSIIDYFSAGIFSLYIGYDLWRASIASRTVRSALHISISLYMDILNLFVSLLSIFDNKD